MLWSILFISLTFLSINGIYGTEEAPNLEARATDESWGIINQIYPAAMNIFKSLHGPADENPDIEVDKTARNTANGILSSMCELARSLTTDIMAAGDDAENMALKAAATEIVKGLYQAAGILSNFVESSTMESEMNGSRAGAEEIIKGLYQAARRITDGIRGSKMAGQVVKETAM